MLRLLAGVPAPGAGDAPRRLRHHRGMIQVTPRLIPPLNLPSLTPTETTPAAPSTPDPLSLPVLSPEAFQQVEQMALCPHWQRITRRGTCVDRWWVGPPMSWVSAAVVTTVGMGLLGWILVAAGKVKRLQPHIQRVRKMTRIPTWE